MDKANSQVMNKENQTPTQCSIPPESKASRGGRTCCVSNCNNNSRNRPDISYHKLPKEPTLRRKWSKLLKTKGLYNPGENNYVCSDHFPGGEKTYENNIPTMLSSETCQPAKRRKVSIVSDDPASTSSKVRVQEGFKENEPESETMIMNEQPEPVIRSLEDQLIELQTNYELQQKYVDDMAKMQQKLFRLERFIASDHEFRFYTGFPDYATFKVFFDYLSPACNNLIYYGYPNGTETVVISKEHKKSGRARTLSPEQELFMVLVRLRCGLLLEDVARRFNLSLSHVSRIWVTWVNFFINN